MEKLESSFVQRNWWLFYVALFLLIGLLVYAILWDPNHKIDLLERQLQNCNTRNRNSPPDDIVNCDASVQSGAQGDTQTQHLLGTKPGTIVLEYNTKSIPDEIEVFYDGQLISSTNGLVAGSGQLQWEYKAESGKPNHCVVKVSAPTPATVWEYIVNCPI